MAVIQVQVPQSAHRHVKAKAVEAGKTMGEYLTALLAKHDHYKHRSKANGEAALAGAGESEGRA